jgi:hypothetical protein
MIASGSTQVAEVATVACRYREVEAGGDGVVPRKWPDAALGEEPFRAGDERGVRRHGECRLDP